MNTYLVTGASGFIGRALCAQIKQRGHRVRTLLRSPAQGPWHESVLGDLSDPSLAEDLLDGVFGVFHCAGAAHFRGLSRLQQEALWQVNVEGTRRLIQQATSSSVRRFVYLSSVQASGKPVQGIADENWHAPPDNIYGESKLAAEGIVLETASSTGMHASILRPALVYGPGVKGNLERMLRAVSSSRMPPLPDSGKQRSMLALDNLLEACWLAMDSDAANQRIYIACDNVSYSTHQLYRAMMNASNRPLPRFGLPLRLFQWLATLGDWGNRISDNGMPWDSAAYERLFGEARYSAERLKTELGWQPQLEFAEALPAMVAALRTELSESKQ